jgi:hypothetical protein
MLCTTQTVPLWDRQVVQAGHLTGVRREGTKGLSHCMSGVQADGDGTKSGDQSYLTKVTIQPANIEKHQELFQ